MPTMRAGSRAVAAKLPEELLARMDREVKARGLTFIALASRALESYLDALDRYDQRPAALKYGLPSKRMLGNRRLPVPPELVDRRKVADAPKKRSWGFYLREDLLQRAHREVDSREVSFAVLLARALVEYLDALADAESLVETAPPEAPPSVDGNERAPARSIVNFRERGRKSGAGA